MNVCEFCPEKTCRECHDPDRPEFEYPSGCLLDKPFYELVVQCKRTSKYFDNSGTEKHSAPDLKSIKEALIHQADISKISSVQLLRQNESGAKDVTVRINPLLRSLNLM